MIASVEDFISYFDGLHRRTPRDVEAIDTGKCTGVLPAGR